MTPHLGTQEVLDLLKRAVEAAVHFSQSTGVECRVIDEDGNLVGRQHENISAHHLPTASCGFCTRVAQCVSGILSCREAHLYGAYQSMRFGGRYTYFCQQELTHICAPLISQGHLVGSFVAGPVLLVDREDILEELEERITTSRDSAIVRGEVPRSIRAVLMDALDHVPEASPVRTRSLGELLLHTATWVSQMNIQEVLADEEERSREARISEYIHQIKTMGGTATTIFSAQAEEELLTCIREGDRSGTQEVLERLVAAVRKSSGEDVETVRGRVLELVVLLSRAAIDGGADAESVFGINYRAIEQVSRIRSSKDLASWMARIAGRFVQFVFDVRCAGRSDAVIKATHFMRRRIGEKIGLEEVAREVRLSPAYLSRIFREETGETFTTRMNQLRIERARTLLRTTTLPVMVIALELGFSDQSHFSRVFRRETGQSPRSYRTAHNYQANRLVPQDTREIHD